jgi:predicted ArsR family transcriptional regulator
MYFVKTNFRKSTRMAILYSMLCRPNGALASELAKRLGVNATRIRTMISELRSRDIKVYSITCTDHNRKSYVPYADVDPISETKYFILNQ